MRKIKKALQLGWFGLRHPAQFFIIWKVRRSGLSFLSWLALAELSEAVFQVEKLGIQGSLIETGCALGGSAITITAAKNLERPLFVYDTFERIPPPSSLDGQDAHQRYEVIQSGQASGIHGGTYYGYLPDLKEQVQKNFEVSGYYLPQNRVTFVQGLFQDTLNYDGQVAFAHLDCDWYESVMTCLQRIVPHLTLGGILIIDDYKDWSGCRKAVDEYFSGQKEKYKFTFRSRLHIHRIA